MTMLGGTGIDLPQFGQNLYSLPAGAIYPIPAGRYALRLGLYAFLQVNDPISNLWVNAWQAGQTGFIESDGANYRVANPTGCAVGAVVTNAGSAYTSVPTVTPSAGNSTWKAILGGALSTTVTVTTAGTGYNHAPTLVFDPPPDGGIQARGIAVVSGGVLSSVTMIDVGAGYTAAPKITIVPHPLDTTATGGVLTATVASGNAAKIAAIVCTDYGTPVTALPTLTIAGGGGASGAATVVPCFAVTGITVGAGGTYGTTQDFLVLSGRSTNLSTPATGFANPTIGPGLFHPRSVLIDGTAAAGAVTTTININDAGVHQAVPLLGVVPVGAVATVGATITATVGGATSGFILQPC